MLNPHIDKKSAVPIWAAFGAPLLGVPLIVGLLALSAPGEAVPAPPADADASFVSDGAEGEVLPEHVAGLSFQEWADIDARC